MRDDSLIVTAIVAMDRNGLIGDGLKMPWHLPKDLKRFRKLTMGKPIIMGRRTFESLPSPLDGRLNIVLSRNSTFRPEGCVVANTIPEAMEIARKNAEETQINEAMIIGGGVVFRETAGIWNRLMLTLVEGEFQGNTYFPMELVKNETWRIFAEEISEADLKNKHAHRLLHLERVTSGELSGVFSWQSL